MSKKTPKNNRSNNTSPSQEKIKLSAQHALQQLDLPADLSVPLLQRLHILTREGRINQDSRRKLKQVLHLLQFIEPIVQDLARDDHSPLLIDHGAGKSYLGFMLYDLILRKLGRGRIVGVEFREELVKQAQQLAQDFHFTGMEFLPLAVADTMEHPALREQVDIVTALHACDTATDDAIAFGIKKRAKAMVLVPCCQAELAALLRSKRNSIVSNPAFAQLWRYPLHAREFGAHLTNVLRCLFLQAHGYQVTVTELVGWEHSMKNELILARFNGQKNHQAWQNLQQLLQDVGLSEELQKRFSFIDL